jgi:hypothetical protein
MKPKPSNKKKKISSVKKKHFTNKSFTGNIYTCVRLYGGVIKLWQLKFV